MATELKSTRSHGEIIAATEIMRDMIAKEVCRVPLTHWGESAFRYFFVRSLLKYNRNAECDAEWHRVDLLIRDAVGNQLVEFKFFITREHKSLAGNKTWKKGGPSPKNLGEFRKCVKKLAQIDHAPWRKQDNAPISGRYIVLAYSDRDADTGRKSYSSSYDVVERWPDLRSIARLTVLAGPKPIRCERSKSTLKIKLLNVR